MRSRARSGFAFGFVFAFAFAFGKATDEAQDPIASERIGADVYDEFRMMIAMANMISKATSARSKSHWKPLARSKTRKLVRHLQDDHHRQHRQQQRFFSRRHSSALPKPQVCWLPSAQLAVTRCINFKLECQLGALIFSSSAASFNQWSVAAATCCWRTNFVLLASQ